MAQVLLHHLPHADPGLFIGDIRYHYDRLWDAIDNEPVNFRQRRRVPDGVRARPLEEIRGELSVERFLGDARVGASVANNVFRILRTVHHQQWGWSGQSLQSAVARCGGLHSAVIYSRMAPELFAAIQRLMIARGLAQQNNVLGVLGYDLLINVMLVAFEGLARQLRRCDVAEADAAERSR